ncbi:SusC/RagA family TonB-linked outer membrane protein [Draconibacterium sp. IB214405]|uniref:SusC/RagA family TonB-linked outer membrane protein n=1 Tax=Draconibacterium sp. IB214405 TaxID=3097352 RepID=UPI002A10FB74|nr:SusC/RagA family TonB-linked outer membrane protein [Draconibacterium sp. IB214405]MDX8339211.1 SusC/RagA family TonB-linked outer membrane protein [Draconibacterium sp. IB214405]
MKKITLIFAYLLFMVSLVQAQTKIITGTVTSEEDGMGIPGVSISVKGTTTGTISDIDGNYTLKVPNDALALVFSFVGMQTLEVEIAGQTVVDAAMESENIAVDEVVVTALGISREKKALGYAVQEVSGDELTKAKDPNIVNSLSGKIAGVQVTSATGAIGGSSRITIRGNSSFSNNQPMFVVDGVPISNYGSSVSQWGGVDYGNGASDIAPENIESITVLKGANAAALYGMNAANGVVLITTKKAKKGKGFEVQLNSSVTFSDAYVIPNYQDKYGQGYSASEYYYNNSGTDMSYQDWSDTYGFKYVDGNGGGVYDFMDESWGPRLDIGLQLSQFDSPVVDGAYQKTPWVSQPNNVKDFFETGVTVDNSISMQTATDKGATRLFLSRQDITGTIPNTDMDRTTASLNSTITATDKLTAQGSITYTQTKSDNIPSQGYTANNVMQSIGGWFGRQVNMNSLKENWDTYNMHGNPYNWNTNYHNNPYWTVNKNTNAMQKDRIYGNMTLDYELAPWLSVMGRLGVDWFHLFTKQVAADGSNGVQAGGEFSQAQTFQHELNADLIFSFNKQITSDFGVNGTVGANYRDYNRHYSRFSASSLTVPDLYTIGNVSGNPSVSQYDSDLQSNSVFGSVSFDYKKWLYLDLTGRNDWSSTLPADSWSFFYPSATMSFLATEALPIKSDILSFAKLRASWAQVGNATNPYQLSMTYVSNSPYDGTTPFRLPVTLPPTGLKPEKVVSMELGTELRFFNNRLGLNATYYDKVTKDQIMQVDISDAAGYDAVMINAGEIENSGVELELIGQVLKSKKGLNWEVVLNWAKNKNTVNELYADLAKYQIGSSWGAVTIEAIPGEAFGVIKAYSYNRNDNGDIVVASNGLPTPGSAPEIVGNVMPDWIGGINNSFSWRNFNASFLIDMRMGGDIFSVTDWFGGMSGVTEETAQMASREGAEGYNIREVGVVVGQDVLKDETVVKADGSTNDIVVSAQDYYERYWGIEKTGMIDGSFVKLREVTFGYTLPASLLDRVDFIKSANISFVGRNMAILWTHKSNDVGIDPETAFGTTESGMGIEQYQLPATRNLGFKLSVTF